MGTINIVEAGSGQWVSARERIDPAERQRFGEGELSSESLWHRVGDDASLQLFEVRFPPDMGTNAHAHDADEIVYIVEGSMVVGSRVLQPGSSMYIAANTLYSFQAGPDGLRFLNFRPQGGSRYVFKDEFMAARSSQRSTGQ